jgi:hypothetical protein
MNMSVSKAHLAALTASVLLSGCTITGAAINAPADLLLNTDQLDVRGIGGRRSGRFTVGGVPATFTRSSDRVAFFDPLVVTRSGGGSFTLSASPIAPELAGRCSFRQTEMNHGPISLTPGRLSYHCEFTREGKKIDAYLSLRDSDGPAGSLTGKLSREGHIQYGSVEMRIVSVHRPQGGGLDSPAPLGYHFSAAGRIIGAVDVNGPGKTIYAPRSGAEREAVIAASLALAVFWDPADTQTSLNVVSSPRRRSQRA